MSTVKYRINISIPDDVKSALISLANRDQMPTATKAEHLIEIGLEAQEDEYWDQIASNRDRKDTKFYTHSEVFGS
jgi:predicted DNA-binding protein